tara:strand:+ start:4900 stop:5343 length:444 start_codon:yes stop_codon:yes gene_type:complete
MRIIAILIVSLFAPVLLGQEIVPINKGDKAPFDGVILDKSAAAEIISKDELSKEECQNKTEYEVSKSTNTCILNKNIAESSLRIERETNKKLTILRNQEIDRLNKRLQEAGVDWGPLWFAGGTTIGIAVSLVIFYLSIQTVNSEPLQ